ncbi:MAG: Carbohydrate binding family 6 [Gammaproteobacteria bacterium]|nr:Carbohydrate binding family 6 [Gammaproteobacteria bacterium]
MRSYVERPVSSRGTRPAALLAATLALPVLAAQAQIPPTVPRSLTDALAPHPDVARVYPLAARFSPGEQAALQVEALSPTGAPLVGPLELTVFHLQDLVYRATSAPVTLRPDAPTTVEFKWVPPPTDFTGYLAVVSVGGYVIGSTGIDISSTPLGYPRYGYLSNFAPDQTPNVVGPTVQRLAQDYHLNMFQFYDWFWRHEKLIERQDGNILPFWLDLFGRTNTADVIHNLVGAVHSYNALAMAYVMNYAAREGYAQLWPIQPSWGMFAQPQAVAQFSLDFSSVKPGEMLFLFDPANPDWQNWMASEYIDAIKTFNFDGVHIDQLGQRNGVLRGDGSPIDLPSAFASFLEATDARLSASDPQRAACTFNIVDGTVDGWAVPQVAGTKACDFLYSEIWFKTNTYDDLRRYVEQLRTIGQHRPVVLAAYAQYGEQAGPLYEAEGTTALTGGAGIANNVPGFTGLGFIDSMDHPGDSISWTIELPEPSPQSLVFRYANASGHTVHGRVSVNGSPVRDIQLPSLADWSAWQTTPHVDAQLAAGTNKVTLAVAEETGGALFVDNLRLEQFDEHAVRLELAAIYASGATSIIIGDDQQGLANEYYPDRSKAIPPPLKRALRDSLSFISAYETLLFAPEVTTLGAGTNRLVAMSGQRLIDKGSNGIWVVPRRIGPYDILHLVNLVTLDDLWRNAKALPPVQTGIRLRYYVGDTMDGVYVATPDFNFGRATSLPYTSGQDQRGRYVEFTVPKLVYWDMVYLHRGG